MGQGRQTIEVEMRGGRRRKRQGEQGKRMRQEGSRGKRKKERCGKLKEKNGPDGEMTVSWGGKEHLMNGEMNSGWGTTPLATHLKQGHVLAIVLLSLLCVGAVDEGTALLGVAIT